MFVAFEELNDEKTTLLVNLAHVVTANVERQEMENPVCLRLTFLGDKSTEATVYFGPHDMKDIEIYKRSGVLRKMLNGGDAVEWTTSKDVESRRLYIELF